MFDNPFYNPQQEAIDAKIKAAVLAIKSEFQSYIATEAAKFIQATAPQQNITTVTKVPQTKKPEDNLAKLAIAPNGQALNYTTDANYQGQDVKFTLFGQVLTPEEEAQFGDINYISFGGGTSNHPFKITSVAQGEEQYVIRVNAGTINGILPSNWSNDFTVEIETYYVVLNVSASSNQIVSSMLSIDSSPPQNEQAPVKWGLPSEFKVVVGIVLGSRVWQVVFNNLSYISSKRITTNRESPQAGQLPYDNWYVWQLNT